MARRNNLRQQAILALSSVGAEFAGGVIRPLSNG